MKDDPNRRPRRLTRRREVASVDEDRTPAPAAVGPSAWLLPDPSEADEDGVVGVGADLAPATLVDAYQRGIFPWPHPGVALPWFSPHPRGLLRTEDVHVSRSLHRTLRNSGWATTVDLAFPAVVANCADRPQEAGTWITTSMARAYRRLHELGWAHSIEVWDGNELVGGLYGVMVGGVFTGESMFHRRDDASKVAMVDLCDRLGEAGGRALDVQITTAHLVSLGAIDVPRSQFLRLLATQRDQDVRLLTTRLPVSRLVGKRGTSSAHRAL
ncbi:MAG TPA: leucyl/phenylalanyl-tRNA--protein transferase [Nitriliruptorales bacterium]